MCILDLFFNIYCYLYELSRVCPLLQFQFYFDYGRRIYEGCVILLRWKLMEFLFCVLIFDIYLFSFLSLYFSF